MSDVLRDKMTPQQRSLRAKAAVYASWANTGDRSARTQPARDAAMARFEKQVDPDQALDPDERAQRAEAARKAYYAGLALKSVQARQGRAADRRRKRSG